MADESKPQAESRETEPVTFAMKRVLVTPLAPPKPISRVAYSAVGGEISLDVGFYDHYELRMGFAEAQAAGKKEAEVSFYVTDRFVVSPSAAIDLLRNAQEMVKFYQGIGALPQDLTELTKPTSLLLLNLAFTGGDQK